MRALLLLVVLLLTALPLRPAHAHDSFKCSNASYTANPANACDKGEAYASANSTANAEAHCTESYPGWTMRMQGLSVVVALDLPAAGQYNAKFTCQRFSNGSWNNVSSATDGHIWRKACQLPKVWDEATHQCFDPGQCLDKAPLNSGLIGATANKGCVGGCEFAPPDGGRTLSYNGSQFITISKGWTPTGKACGVELPTPNQEDPQICKDLGNGQTACVKQDGQECYKGPIGSAMQFCWKPGEVGDKNDGKNRQKRNAGETPIAPNLSLPSGDNLQQQGPPIVTQVTNNNTTTTTTTTNFQTQHGTDANGGGTPSGDGEPDDGSGKPDEGEGEGTATGGGDCKSPPIVTGDQVLGMVANQAWQTRCAVEAGNAAKVIGDVGDCANPFSVEGDHANAQQLRAMRAQICGDDTNGNKRPDWTETNGTEEPGPGEGDEEPGFIAKTLSLDNLDGSGFLGGAGSCPQMGVVDLSFTQVDLSNASWWCPFVQMCRGILLLMGLFISVRLLME